MKYYNEDLETAFSIRYPEEPIQTDAAKEVVENYEYSEPGKSGDIEEFLNRDFGSKEKSSTIYAAQAGEKVAKKGQVYSQMRKSRKERLSASIQEL